MTEQFSLCDALCTAAGAPTNRSNEKHIFSRSLHDRKNVKMSTWQMTNREDGLCMIVCNMFQTLNAEKEVLFSRRKLLEQLEY